MTLLFYVRLLSRLFWLPCLWMIGVSRLLLLLRIPLDNCIHLGESHSTFYLRCLMRGGYDRPHVLRPGGHHLRTTLRADGSADGLRHHRVPAALRPATGRPTATLHRPLARAHRQALRRHRRHQPHPSLPPLLPLHPVRPPSPLAPAERRGPLSRLAPFPAKSSTLMSLFRHQRFLFREFSVSLHRVSSEHDIL